MTVSHLTQYDDSLKRPIAIAGLGHGVIILVMILVEFLGLGDNVPLIDVNNTMEVSMVVLPKSKRAVPERATRAPTPVAPPVDKPTEPTAKPSPVPDVPQSDLVIKTKDAAPTVDHTDARAKLMRELELQALLANAPEGARNRPQTDPDSQTDEYINAGGIGLASDPEFARYVAQLQTVFMKHFAPLLAITDANPNLVATLQITVNATTGLITTFSIQTSSGNASFDAAANRAVQAVTSVPLPPEKYMDALNGGFVVRFEAPRR